MGLFSDRRRLPRSIERAARGVRSTALAASNDARIVAVVLVLAGAALAVEMTASFK
jgi:hypothetical protein